MFTKLSLKQPSSNSPGIITWNLFKKRGQKEKMAKRREAVGGRRHYSPGGSWKIDGVSKVVAVVSVSYRDGRQVRGCCSSPPLIALPRGGEARVLSIFFSLSHPRAKSSAHLVARVPDDSVVEAVHETLIESLEKWASSSRHSAKPGPLSLHPARVNRGLD